MLTISTLLMVRSVARMLKSRFLHPTDLAVLGTWYYTVPLSFFGFMQLNPQGRIFLHAAAASPDLALDSLQYCLVAIIALLSGQAIGNLVGPARLVSFFRLDRSGETRSWILFMLLVGFTLIGVAQFGVDEFFEGYATESDAQGATLGMALVYFAVGCFGLIVAYMLLIYRRIGNRSSIVLIGLSLLAALVVLLIRAKRLEVVITLLPAIIVLLSNRKSYKATTSRFIIGIAALVALVSISISRVGDKFDLAALNFYFLSEGLYAGHSLPGLMGRLNAHMIDYEYGVRFISAILAFVPRFVWPEKDDIVYAGNLALEGVSPLGATTLLGEIVLQGGMIAVVICYVLIGFLFDRVARFESGWDQAIANGYVPTRFIAYLVLTTTFVPHFRDGIIPAIKLSLQAGAFMYFVVGARSRLQFK
jgi:hypothetical protein